MLCLVDKHGRIDKTPQAIAASIGIAVDELCPIIDELCKPDPNSRSQEMEGRRLALIDPARTWGWQVVNHLKYREKARLAAKNAKETENRRNPPVSAADRLSNANTNTDKKDVEPERSTGDLDRVFGHWQTVHKHPNAKLDAKRKRAILAALKTYSADDLCRAIDGYKHSPFHMGKNDQFKVHDGISLFLRDAEHIDSGLKLADRAGEIRW